jgi:mannosyltransferase OCH1-like enzyme
MITKKIFQTHEWDYCDLPENFKKTSMSWINLNPGWEYIYHNREERADFVLTYYPYLYESFLKYPGMLQSDVWRYCIVYKYGGVYADMDSVCRKPLDYMLEAYTDEDLLAMDKDSVASPEREKGYVNNSNFAAVKNSKVLKKVIEDLYGKMLSKEQSGRTGPPITWYCFADNASNLDGIVFDAAIHDDDFKRRFPDFHIDLYGKSIKYSEYLKNNT